MVRPAGGGGSAPQGQNNFAVGRENLPAAKIKIDRVKADGPISSAQPSESNWDHYLIINRYEKDGHIYMLPVSSPGGFQGQSVAFCRLAAPTLLWICDWTVQRTDKIPSIPDPAAPAASPLPWILLDEHYEPLRIDMEGDGQTPTYRLSGTYVYGHTNPSAQTIDDINFPIVPYIKDVFERKIKKSDLVANLSIPKNETVQGIIRPQR